MWGTGSVPEVIANVVENAIAWSPSSAHVRVEACVAQQRVELQVVDRGPGIPPARREDVAAYVLHPGGQKLLSYVEQELGLCHCHTQPSWDVLKDYGNLSSASVIFVLHEWLERGHFGALRREAAAGGGDRQNEQCGDLQRDGQRHGQNYGHNYGLMAAFGPGFSAEMLLLQWR